MFEMYTFFENRTEIYIFCFENGFDIFELFVNMVDELNITLKISFFVRDFVLRFW